MDGMGKDENNNPFAQSLNIGEVWRKRMDELTAPVRRWQADMDAITASMESLSAPANAMRNLADTASIFSAFGLPVRTSAAPQKAPRPAPLPERGQAPIHILENALDAAMNAGDLSEPELLRFLDAL